MSYPLYLLSCCHGDSDGHLINSTLSRDHLIFTDDITNVFCIISSTLSLLGVFYLLLPRGNLDLTTPLTHTRILTGPSLKSTVLSLFAADCLAAAGILIRSCVWLAGYPVPASYSKGTLEENSYVFCIAINVWIQYFYVCTYFWNLNFALELFTSLKHWPKTAWTRNLLGWVLPGVVCIIGAVVAFYPSLDRCYGTRNLEWTILFLSVFLPVSLVVIINPIIFLYATRTIRKELIFHSGKYTHSERGLVEAVQLKLVLIFIVFIFCWTPNIIAAILEGIPGEDATFFDVLQILWIVMAICNPFQALLNCLAYYGWPGWKASCEAVTDFLCHSNKTTVEERSALFLSTSCDKNCEATPILTFKGRRGSTFYTDT
ncbi:G-protein coupled receptor 143-like [Haliotis rufescens]|uniref:G-protein coupled receptor 143-like n=1 Tax=Haliotis rufescens TaxID=6454 RepID=UPI00201F4787|nr:G-protein coupled receptor 143-like [Haliotis rufescens]XP_046356031.2 G-protein coupled receptor 143-like [Haliotis rufescens]